MGATLTQWYHNTFEFLPNLLLIVLILLMTRIFSRRTQGLVQRMAGRTQAPPGVVDLLGRLARFAILALGFLLVLDRLGWSQAALSFLAGLGIVGIAIGFALQDIVKQFAAGVLLLMLRPFNIGDNVKIGAFEGNVIQVQLRATVLKTADGNEVLIPNADVYTTAITNHSRYQLRRHDIPLNLTPAPDLARTSAVLAQAAQTIPGVADNPAPQVVAAGIDGQVLKLEVRCWIDERASNVEAVKTAVITAVQQALAEPSDGTERGRQSEEETG
ncbi:MAG TPA: mechanosensitive ion channel family protein [Roseiflexaceae bacterium]|nr:mechanosensitive ion channel family protein [Roseiflexaceae bacterium]